MNSMLSRRSRCSSDSSSSTAACTETSSADVTSSQTSRSGFAASARAIATRWRSPPESSIGKRSATRRGRRTRSSSSPTSRSASPRLRRRSTRSGRSIDELTRCRGLSDSNGFWKTIWIRRRWSSERRRADAGELLAVEHDPPGRRLVKAGDAPADGGLAAARLADQGDAAALRDARTRRRRRRHGCPWRYWTCRPETSSSASSLAATAATRAPSGRRSPSVSSSQRTQRTAWASRRLLERRDAAAAAVLLVLAARREGAAGRPLADADRHAGDALQRARVAEVGDRGHQRPRVRVLGPLDDVGGGAVLDHAAGVHDDDPVGHLGDHREVVRHVDHRHAVLVAQPGELRQDPVLGEHVQPGGRLVEHGDRGLADAGHGDRHPLLLAAGELVRIALAEARVGAQLDARQRGLHRLVGGGRRPVRAQDVHDRVADPHRGVERAAGILRARRRRPCRGRCAGDFASRPMMLWPPTSITPERTLTPVRV